MNPWFAAALGRMLALVPRGIDCLRGTVMQRLTAFLLSNSLRLLILLVLAGGLGREFLFDLALAQAGCCSARCSCTASCRWARLNRSSPAARSGGSAWWSA